jgi:hypothetical protein
MRTLMLLGILAPLASAESVVAAPDCHLLLRKRRAHCRIYCNK